MNTNDNVPSLFATIASLYFTLNAPALIEPPASAESPWERGYQFGNRGARLRAAQSALLDLLVTLDPDWKATWDEARKQSEAAVAAARAAHAADVAAEEVTK
jgi:hypothetical protein